MLFPAQDKRLCRFIFAAKARWPFMHKLVKFEALEQRMTDKSL